jgi:protein-disulfide isomerase
MQTLAPESMAKTVATLKPHFRKFSFAFAATALLGSASALVAQAKPNWLLTFSVSAKGGHIIGNPSAPNKIVEYASYTCGHCAHFEADDVPLVKDQLVATGKTSFEVRNLVRDPLDLTAAMLARCGGKGRFFGNHKLLMATQAQWTDGSKVTQPTIALLEAKKTVAFMQAAYTELGFDKIMAQRGITAAQGKACLADKASFDAIIAMTEEATQSLKINSTPTLMVNGKIIQGHEFADLKQHISNIRNP